MRIAIMGSGGVGGFFGARLAQGGAEVHFIARGAHLKAMQDDGLRVESQLGDLHLKDVRVTQDPATIGPVDLVLFSVKLWDTESAAESIKPLIGRDTAVISFQNGVVKDDMLKRVLGEQRVMGGVCYIATSIGRPGVIKHVGTMQRMVFGEYDGSSSPRALAFLEALKRGGVNAELSGDIRRMLWEKYVFLVGLSATTTTMRQSIGPIRTNPRTRAFLFDLMREVVAVGRAHGVALPEDYADDRLKFADGVPAEMTASMHHDLERGNRLEVDWLSGGVVTLGEAVGVPAPLNRAVRDILTLHAGGRAKG